MSFFDFIEHLMLGAFRMLAGNSSAVRLETVAQWHHPILTPPVERPRRSRMYMRSLIYARSTAQWLEFLWSTPSLLFAARHNPDLCEKIHRPYMMKRLACEARRNLLTSHYRLTQQHPVGALLLLASLQRQSLGKIQGKTGQIYELTLEPSGSLQKEGELKLSLEHEGQSIMALAFTCGDDQKRPALFVGCLQGSPHSSNRDSIKDATKEMFGLRPRNLLLTALQALAEGLGAFTILAVNDQEHIYRHWRKRKTIFQSYDAMWSDLGARQRADGLFVLPTTLDQRPLSEYPSNKRGTIAKRNTLELQTFKNVLDRVRERQTLDAIERQETDLQMNQVRTPRT